MESGGVCFVQTVSLFLSAVLKAPFLLFSPGIWFLLPLLTSLISRMTVTKVPSQTKTKSQPVIFATPPLQPNTKHPTPVVVGQIIFISLCVCVCVCVCGGGGGLHEQCIVDNWNSREGH